jgi:hypothetical protein
VESEFEAKFFPQTQPTYFCILKVFTGKEIHEGQHQLSVLDLGATKTWPQYGEMPMLPTPGEIFRLSGNTLYQF